MAIRYQVERGFVYYRKRAYFKGEFMPETFTERDKNHNVFSRRLKDVTLEVIPSEGVQTKESSSEVANSVKGVNTAEPDEKLQVPKLPPLVRKAEQVENPNKEMKTVKK